MQIFSSFANIASPSLLGKDAKAEIQDLLPDAWMLSRPPCLFPNPFVL